METPTALSVAPMNAPHKDLDYLPLADKYFQIRDLAIDINHLNFFCQAKDQYLNGSDILRLWELNLPRYFLPSIHIFPDLTHQCQANYNPNLRVFMSPIMSPSQTILLLVTAASINEMLQFSHEQALTPLSMGYLRNLPNCLSQNWLTFVRFSWSLNINLKAHLPIYTPSS